MLYKIFSRLRLNVKNDIGRVGGGVDTCCCSRRVPDLGDGQIRYKFGLKNWSAAEGIIVIC